MRIAYVHQLPLEIYPPAKNALAILSRQPGFQVAAWSSPNHRGAARYEPVGHALRRPGYPPPGAGGLARFFGFLRWHFRVAAEIAAWEPAAVVSVEPHSALAVWLLLKWHRCRARLFIHHHEYYAPADFLRAGNRTSRICAWFEKRHLFPAAEWVSQTNEDRLNLLREDHPVLSDRVCRVWPNHPPERWVAAAAALRRGQSRAEGPPLRLVCVGSLSFEDTFIRELAEWVVAHPGTVSLHVCGDNIKVDVRDWLRGLGAGNITTDFAGVDYEQLPSLLVRFDVSVVLYRGNTLNFTYNVPNKVFEALACGLEVWYPVEMTGMDHFRAAHPALPLRRVNFRDLDGFPVPAAAAHPVQDGFSAEQSIAPLLAQLLGKEASTP